MRLVLPSLVLIVLALIVLVTGLGDAGAVGMERAAPRTCADVDPTRLVYTAPSKVNALALLESVTQLLAPRGRPVLDSNFATTVAINNRASPAQRAEALLDAQVTDENAFALADGLGATMGDAYRRKADFKSDNDGLVIEIGKIGPKVDAVIEGANQTSATDSGEAKCAFASGIEPYQGGLWVPPAGGTFDVFGKAYHREAGMRGADVFGNSRPFQTAPIDAPDGPQIRTWPGKDFFGVSTNSRIMLIGAAAAGGSTGLTGSDLADSPSYPSGHTTYGYTEALLFAMMVPERYRALAYRGSEYGHSRIVIGAHYALDVIAGRTLATYDLAQGLAGRPGYPGSLRLSIAAAAVELRAYLKANGCPSIAACAREPIARAEMADVFTPKGPEAATPARAYRFRLTYGLAPLGPVDAMPEPVPPEAASLLETRFPYLTHEQRLEILRTTEGPSGHFLDIDPVTGAFLSLVSHGAASEAGVYSRLDLFAAAGGFARFDGTVVVDQDAEAVKDLHLRPFTDLARTDVWSNDIDGSGGLTKRGSGTLTLAGVDTYAGPTLVEDGTVEVAGSIHSAVRVAKGGTLGGAGRVGDVMVAAGGTLAPGAPDGGGTLAVAGSLTLDPGSRLALHGGANDAKLKVAGQVNLDGAVLVLREGGALKPGASLTLIEAKGGVSGTFAKVQALSPSLVPNLTYSAKAVYLTLDDAPPASRKAVP